MFSTPPILKRIWNAISSVFQTETPGQIRPVSYYTVGTDQSDIGRNFDLEIREPIVRSPDIARPLVEMIEFCPEASAAIIEIRGSVLSSDDGDDMGFTIADEVATGVNVEPEIKKLLDRVVDEVLGGTNSELAIERMLEWGDAFAGIGVNTKLMQIDRMVYLPTWEMFRIEDNQSRLLGYEQRRFLTDHRELFHPLTICHWRFRRKMLYGRSLFAESVKANDWEHLKQATEDLAAAARSIGINPNVHRLPDGCDDEYATAYRTQYEEAKRRGTVTDFYLMPTADVAKVGNLNPDLTALANTVLLWRQRIAMSSRVPNYLLGIHNAGAKDIAGQPALGYARFINSIRRNLTEGIRQICDLELALHGIPKERWLYAIKYPRIGVNPYGKATAATDDNNTLIGNEDA